MEKKEVVFMPYNASMWDCFNSVYRAAIQDEEWNVVVMPIPYYNIGKKCEILGEYYEGDKFPKDVKIVDYREYDLEKQSPEIIFYHNPYDKYNKVTRISEKYYSSTLKKYCRHLVYIPYDIVCKHIDPYKCLMPGVQNAWRIVVENGRVMEQYIQYGKISREKVLSLGSPKIDSVLSVKKTTQFPKQWKEKLSGKKIFLYNTHLNEIINAPYGFIKKMENIIDYFEKEQDIALLWRPHPLIMETIKSFQKEILHSYLEIIDKVKETSNVVYDDTPEMEHAISVADAYIGPEQSSVSALFEVTRKPILYVNVNNESIFNTKRCIRCFANGVIDNKMYMYSYENNIIIIMQSDTGEIELVRGYDGICAGMEWVTAAGIVYEENIYFITVNEECIIKFKTNSKTLEIIDMKYTYDYFTPVFWRNKILFFPNRYSTDIPCIDVKTDEVTYIPTRYEEELNFGIRERLEDLFYGNQIVDNVLYRGCYIAPIIQKYYLYEKRFEYIEIKGINGGISNVVYDGKYFWMLFLHSSYLLKWDEEENTILDVIDLDGYMDVKDAKWRFVYYENNIIYICQENGAYIVKIDLEQLDIICFDCREISGFESPVSEQAFSEFVQYRDGKIMFFPYKANGIVSIAEDGSIFFYKTEVDTNEMLKLFPKEERIYNESMCSISQFVQIVKEREEESHSKISKCGTNIWQILKQELKKDI